MNDKFKIVEALIQKQVDYCNSFCSQSGGSSTSYFINGKENVKFTFSKASSLKRAHLEKTTKKILDIFNV